MLPVLRRFGRPTSVVDPLLADDFLGIGREIDRMVSRVFEGLSSSWSLDPWGRWAFRTPWEERVLPFASEVLETDDEVRIAIEAPGFRMEDLEVTVEGNVLNVSGENRQERKEENSRFWLNERRFGRFQRSYLLPEGVDKDAIEATYQDGILTLRLPKREEARPRRLKIKAGGLMDRLLSGVKREKEKEKEKEAEGAAPA